MFAVFKSSVKCQIKVPFLWTFEGSDERLRGTSVIIAGLKGISYFSLCKFHILMFS